MNLERPYAGQLAHERKAARREALIEAGFQQLGTEGVQGTTVRAVFQGAGLSQRYFYESFASLDDLLVAVFDRVMEGVLAAAVDGLPADGDLRASIASVFKAFDGLLDDPLATRIAFIEAWGNEALMRRRLENLHTGARLLATIAKSGVADPPDDGSVEIAAHSIVGGLLESMLAWVDGVLDVPRERLFRRFADLAVVTMEHALVPVQPGVTNPDS